MQGLIYAFQKAQLRMSLAADGLRIGVLTTCVREYVASLQRISCQGIACAIETIDRKNDRQI
jgi:hypothetical protein